MSDESPWRLRAISAGLAAALIGTTLGTAEYVRLPGAHVLDWTVMPWILIGFVGVSGVLAGLGIGGGMVVAMRSARASGPRLVFGGMLGGTLGCFVPALLGIAGFGSLHAPYAGTANIALSLVLGCAVFVALWAPALRTSSSRLRVVVARATIAAFVTCGAIGIAGWTLVSALGSTPTLETWRSMIDVVGPVPFSLAGALVLGALIGAIMGLATWIALRLDSASHTQSSYAPSASG